jgi:hypothetical protein
VDYFPEMGLVREVQREGKGRESSESLIHQGLAYMSGDSGREARLHLLAPPGRRKGSSGTPTVGHVGAGVGPSWVEDVEIWSQAACRTVDLPGIVWQEVRRAKSKQALEAYLRHQSRPKRRGKRLLEGQVSCTRGTVSFDTRWAGRLLGPRRRPRSRSLACKLRT